MTTRLIAVLLALLVLAGCSASTGTSDSEPAGGAEQAAVADGSRADGAAVLDAGDAADDDAAANQDGDGADDGADVGVSPGTTTEGGPMMVRRVTMEVQVDDVTKAVTRARATASGSGGWVESEEVVPGGQDRPGHASLVLRVPSEGLDSVVASLGELGTVTGSRSSADDVKAEYKDVEARIATLEASADRLRELIGDATGVEAIAGLERELASREADLDGLKARLAVLADDVSRSTVTLHLAEDPADLGQTQERSGFLGGLQQGWAAFIASVSFLLTALGALLPFLVLALLLLTPVLWWRRRRARGRSPRIWSKGDRHPDAAGDPDRA